MRPVFLKAFGFLFLCAAIGAIAAPPAESFSSATLTRVENKVFVGKVRDGKVAEQVPASVTDTVQGRDFLRTQTESRAELQFTDKSIVRVGQNTVFSFDVGSRTLSLERGSMLFYVPPGTDRKIKTTALTAAVTGTIVKCTPNMMAVVAGSIETPWGKVEAGHAVRWENGKAVFFKYPAKEATSGWLYAWGPLPELPEVEVPFDPRFGLPDERWWNIQDIAVLNPRVNEELSNLKPEPMRDDSDDSSSSDSPRRRRPRHRPSPTSSPGFSPFSPIETPLSSQ